MNPTLFFAYASVLNGIALPGLNAGSTTLVVWTIIGGVFGSLAGFVAARLAYPQKWSASRRVSSVLAAAFIGGVSGLTVACLGVSLSGGGDILAQYRTVGCSVIVGAGASAAFAVIWRTPSGFLLKLAGIKSLRAAKQ
jgi:H+/Cl- antiporter ClcA